MRLVPIRIYLAVTAALGLLTIAISPARAADYVRDVKPLLAERCSGCHGAIRQKGGLRVDTADLLQRGGESGPAIEPGKSQESLLIERVTAAGANRSMRMPPPGEGVALDDAEIGVLRQWIDEGAIAPPETIPPNPRRHWAYVPPARPAAPGPADDRWSSNPIDAFVASGHRSRGLSFSPQAGREILLRRVYLDLVGLPPTPEELHQFLGDSAPGAYERVVDRLLASPRYGERWARHWMDIWRYSDWYGLGAEARYSHPHIWHWRDWIVSALNADEGYDRMVTAMLAADEVAPNDAERAAATGFLVRNWDIFSRNAWLGNTVEHTAKAFLGMTIQCARCHDHKFDPISQRDYYQFRAFFEPVGIRIDRLPGQPDRNRGGMPRIFDDFLDSPTYLFIRGDEKQPEKHPLSPATPAVLGGEVWIKPVSLPAVVSSPDKREFVIRETVEASEKEVERAANEQAKAAEKLDRKAKTLAAAVCSEHDQQAQFHASLATLDDMKVLRVAAAAAVNALALARLEVDEARLDHDLAVSALSVAERGGTPSSLFFVPNVSRTRAPRPGAWIHGTSRRATHSPLNAGCRFARLAITFGRSNDRSIGLAEPPRAQRLPRPALRRAKSCKMRFATHPPNSTTPGSGSPLPKRKRERRRESSTSRVT